MQQSQDGVFRILLQFFPLYSCVRVCTDVKYDWLGVTIRVGDFNAPNLWISENSTTGLFLSEEGKFKLEKEKNAPQGFFIIC